MTELFLRCVNFFGSLMFVTCGPKHAAIFSAISFYTYEEQVCAFCLFWGRESRINSQSLACPEDSYYLSVAFEMQNSLKINYAPIHSGAGTAYGDWLLAGRSQV